MSTRKRTSLSAAQKRELCEAKKNNPSLSNVELEYNVVFDLGSNIHIFINLLDRLIVFLFIFISTFIYI